MAVGVLSMVVAGLLWAVNVSKSYSQEALANHAANPHRGMAETYESRESARLKEQNILLRISALEGRLESKLNQIHEDLSAHIEADNAAFQRLLKEN